MKSQQHNNSSQVQTALESRARALLLDSIHTIDNNENNYTYITEWYEGGIIESTTTLISARVFSKIGNADLSWEFLRALFCGQGSNGFIPRFVYMNTTDVNTGKLVVGSGWVDFVGPYPGPKLFPNSPNGNEPDNLRSKSVNIWTSNTIMAPPFHATTVLEVFYLSNQTDEDVDQLEQFYMKLKQWHNYLHKRIVPNCASTQQHTPCLLVNHPWETDIEMNSKLWKYALENTTKIVTEQGWTPNIDSEISSTVKAYDWPGDETYNTLLYLLQCLSEHADNDDDNKNNTLFYSPCPFQMIDVGTVAALSKADQDLLQIGQILKDKNRIVSPKWSAEQIAKERLHISKTMSQQLWSDDDDIFFDSMVNLTLDANGTYTSNITTPLTLPIAAASLPILWNTIDNSTILEGVSSHLLQHTGPNSFYCGNYPLWSMGGCSDSDSYITLLLNYRVAKGLRHNKELGLAHYIESSSLNLICGTPNSDENNLTNCSERQRFARTYDANTHLPIDGMETSCLTAAIVVDILNPDKAFTYTSEPPISRSSVIFLIGVELIVAFGIGIVCVLLSLNLLRRASADQEGDEFVQIREEEEEDLIQSLGEESYHNPNDQSFFSQSRAVELISSFIPSNLWPSTPR